MREFTSQLGPVNLSLVAWEEYRPPVLALLRYLGWATFGVMTAAAAGMLITS
jgi:hypothetical protein